MKKEVIVLSLGGSVFLPDKIDIKFLLNFRKLIIKYLKKHKFVIITGGGKFCRYYQGAVKQFPKKKQTDADMMGIFVSRLNAKLIRFLFKDIANKKLMKSPRKKVNFKNMIIVAGWEPGHSTDWDAVLAAKAYGAKKVFATDIDDYRLKLAKKVGADVVINAKEDIVKQIKKQNDGNLADFVILCAGVPSAVKQAIEVVEFGGTILWFAMTPPGIEVPVPFFDIWNKQIKMYSTYAGAGDDITEAIELLKNKKIDVNDMITHKLPMDKTPEGFKLVANAEESMKVIIEPQK